MFSKYRQYVTDKDLILSYLLDFFVGKWDAATIEEVY